MVLDVNEILRFFIVCRAVMNGLNRTAIQTVDNSNQSGFFDPSQPRYRSLFEIPGDFSPFATKNIFRVLHFFLDFCFKICMLLTYGHTE